MFRFILVSALIACVAATAEDAYATGSQFLDIQPDGQYQYRYDTSNGITGQESGYAGYSVSGSNAYYSPEGQLIQTTYVADENGYQPQGAHLPTPPPIPDYILRSLEYIRTHPQYDEPQQQQQQFSRPAASRGQKRIFG
ncbi:pupal cuticle protein Edg-78E-like [Drosophila sulfurigaster albostrigata]|uniref:pupal cuticle protein Edg-78E-like n=1 Tax=Drosophila sulfurigaster albostrigata TaxID=89887 RepID=UPI002D21E5FC|nr:pupal cuticle protein Edg-78E-like [Drosophila sulfurigaster albostrigata]